MTEIKRERFSGDTEMAELMQRVSEHLERQVLALVLYDPLTGATSLACPKAQRESAIAILQDTDWAALREIEVHG